MAIILRVENSDGVVGQCSARCYDAAPNTKCRCICGGRNHGAGITLAAARTAELAENWRGKRCRADTDPRSKQQLLGIFGDET